MISRYAYIALALFLFLAACAAEVQQEPVVEEPVQEEPEETETTTEPEETSEAETLEESAEETSEEAPEEAEPEATEEETTVTAVPTGWKDYPLTDVRTGETFTIEQFEGKQVILESFAVWCPICTKQQRNLKALHEVDSDVVSIAINTDPNEDEERVREHIERHGFDWLYAVAQPEMTQSLIQEFGTPIINAPGAPVVVICEDGEANLINSRAVKSVERLQEELAACA